MYKLWQKRSTGVSGPAVLNTVWKGAFATGIREQLSVHGLDRFSVSSDGTLCLTFFLCSGRNISVHCM